MALYPLSREALFCLARNEENCPEVLVMMRSDNSLHPATLDISFDDSLVFAIMDDIEQDPLTSDTYDHAWLAYCVSAK